MTGLRPLTSSEDSESSERTWASTFWQLANALTRKKYKSSEKIPGTNISPFASSTPSRKRRKLNVRQTLQEVPNLQNSSCVDENVEDRVRKLAGRPVVSSDAKVEDLNIQIVEADHLLLLDSEAIKSEDRKQWLVNSPFLGEEYQSETNHKEKPDHRSSLKGESQLVKLWGSSRQLDGENTFSLGNVSQLIDQTEKIKSATPITKPSGTNVAAHVTSESGDSEAGRASRKIMVTDIIYDEPYLQGQMRKKKPELPVYEVVKSKLKPRAALRWGRYIGMKLDNLPQTTLPLSLPDCSSVIATKVQQQENISDEQNGHSKALPKSEISQVQISNVSLACISINRVLTDNTELPHSENRAVKAIVKCGREEFKSQVKEIDADVIKEKVAEEESVNTSLASNTQGAKSKGKSPFVDTLKATTHTPKQRRRKFKRYERSNRRVVINPSSESESADDLSSLLDEDLSSQKVEIVPNGSVDYNDFESLVMEELLRDKRLLQALQPISVDEEENTNKHLEQSIGENPAVSKADATSTGEGKVELMRLKDETERTDENEDLLISHASPLVEPPQSEESPVAEGENSDIDYSQEIDALKLDFVSEAKRRDKQRKINNKRKSLARKLYREQLRSNLEPRANEISTNCVVEKIVELEVSITQPTGAISSIPASVSKINQQDDGPSMNHELTPKPPLAANDITSQVVLISPKRSEIQREERLVVPTSMPLSHSHSLNSPRHQHNIVFQSPNQSQTLSRSSAHRIYYSGLIGLKSKTSPAGGSNDVDLQALKRAGSSANWLGPLTQTSSQSKLSQFQKASKVNTSEIHIVIPNSSCSVSEVSLEFTDITGIAIDSPQNSRSTNYTMTSSPLCKSEATQTPSRELFKGAKFHKIDELPSFVKNTSSTNRNTVSSTRRRITLIPITGNELPKIRKIPVKSFIEQLREGYRQAGNEFVGFGVDSDHEPD